VRSLEEAEKVDKEAGGEFFEKKKAAETLKNFFKKRDFEVIVLDGGTGGFENRIETGEIGKFLSFSINEISLENFLGNRLLRPHTIPKNIKELEIEEAVLRNILAKNLQEATNKKQFTIVGTGGLISGTPSVSRLANLFLDILGVGDVAAILFDREFFLFSFGALLAKYKQLQIVKTGDWLDNLGAFFSLGSPSKVTLDWGYSQVQEVQLEKDEIALIPVPLQQKIGVGFSSNNEKRHVSVFGGSLGLVLDARAKPLQLTFGQHESRNKVAAWLKNLENTKMIEEAF